MLRTILVDDEQNSLDVLRLELQANCPQVEVIGEFLTPGDALSAIMDMKPELLFLDIQMPEMNGFELLDELGDIEFDVIFCTAYDQYSMQAIKVSALDYLLKPVDPDELIKAVAKVEQNLQLRRSKEQVEFLLTNLRGSADRKFTKIALPTLKGLDFVDVDDILLCQAEGNYTSIRTVDKNSFLISRTLSEFEEMLDNDRFFRTHKSYLVNLDHIKQYIKGSGGQVILKDGTSVQVARARKEVLLDLIYKR